MVLFEGDHQREEKPKEDHQKPKGTKNRAFAREGFLPIGVLMSDDQKQDRQQDQVERQTRIKDAVARRVVCDDCTREHAPDLYGLVVHFHEQARRARERKAKLLEHYGQREPKLFYQYDGFIMDPNSHDCVMHPDEDGDCIMGPMTWELMAGADVRVLIPARDKPTPQRAAQILRKIAMCIERDGLREVGDNGEAPVAGEIPF
jgi:hypothetical protein